MDINEQQSQIPSADVVGPVIGNRLMSASEVLSQTGDELRSMQLQALAAYADQAASWIQQFSQFMRERGVENTINDISSTARKRPELFVGGLLLVGFALARRARERRIQNG